MVEWYAFALYNRAHQSGVYTISYGLFTIRYGVYGILRFLCYVFWFVYHLPWLLRCDVVVSVAFLYVEKNATANIIKCYQQKRTKEKHTHTTATATQTQKMYVHLISDLKRPA